MPETMTTASNVALLTPVPLEHLVDGQQVVQNAGKVAFGIQKWETFRGLDIERRGQPVDVYIYESHGKGHYDFKVSWRGRYIGHVESKGGAHPDGMKCRPPSTGKYSSDNSGYWAVFWELDLLEKIPEREREREMRIHVSEFTGYGKKKAYGHAFSPEGPLLIEHP